MKKKGQKAYSILNISMGVIMFMSSFILFAEEEALAGMVLLPLGLAFGISGWLTLRRLRNENVPEKTMKMTLTVNFVLFILSCIFLASCIILPIVM